MAWTPSLLHALHLAASRGAFQRFAQALEHPEAVQRHRLGEILAGRASVLDDRDLRPDTSYEQFRDRVPPSTYADIAEKVERQHATGEPWISPPTDRWQPTSGSTDRRKWIPYPPAFRTELDAAAGAWLVDLSHRHPRAFRGRHYWSLSWLPGELRARGAETDDLSLLPPWKRWAMAKVMAVPGAVRLLGSSEEAHLATAACLTATRDLTLLSVWSPTFALALLRRISGQRLELAEILDHGRWDLPLPAPRNRRAASLLRAWDGGLVPAFFQELWPDLALVSAWDAAASAHHGRVLAGILPQAFFQGKGLWATEGVVSIPFRDQKPLALTSHFLEFRCLSTGRIQPGWALEEGQRVQPLLTTSSGLLRYALEDDVRVEGRCGRTPCLTFAGRLGGIDLVGEKLDRTAVSEVLLRLEVPDGTRGITLFAVDQDVPHYCLLAEGPGIDSSGLARQLEAALGAFHHYRLARELGQLDPARVRVVPDAAPWLMERSRQRGQTAGEGKVSPLERWDLPGTPESFLEGPD